ncbi:GTP-binding protein [Aquibium sp. A9E412]|uniref:CobW family GTP-binding protein n=1 Tax=Aquibium sp. A9E412 TaxID=2976767 RepID=UPI0025AFD07E|nr:GTP-binding protein [Aquibium sp. A9E412]MDN2565582.1 GTP-binding protein [Aquibium sp. A9E412]
MSGGLPVTVVTGYLGAGKTTLINDLLAQPHGRRITVLVNDFGEIAIDEALIVSRSGDTIALANGCLCCSLGDDLFDALDRILSAPALPDHLVIETSGVADPRRVTQIALAEPMLAAHGTVTVVDPLNLAATLDDALLADTVRRQLAAADLAVVSKAALCDAAALDQACALAAGHLPARAPVLVAGRTVPAEVLLDRLIEAGGAAPGASGDAAHPATYRSWSYAGDRRIARAALDGLLRRDDLGIYRLKGFVGLDDGSTVLVQKAGGRATVEPAAAAVGSRLVAIGAAGALDPAALERLWRSLSVADAGPQAVSSASATSRTPAAMRPAGIDE